MTATLERTAVTVDQPALQLATSWVARALPRRAPSPALAGIRLTSHGGELTLAAWDWTTYCTATVEADGDLGEVLVSGILLAGIADDAPRSSVSLAIDGPRMLITAGRDRHRLLLMAGEEYPTTPQIPQEQGAVYDFPAALARAVSAAGDAAVGEHQVQCVRLSAEGGVLTAYATQSARFTRASAEWDGPDFEVLVDARRLLAVAKPLGSEIRLGWNENLLSLSDNSRTAVLSLTQGKFSPTAALQQLFRRPSAGGYADVDRDELLDSLHRVGRMDASALGAVDLTFADDSVELASAAEELGDSISAIPCHLDTQVPVQLRVTRTELVDALRNVPAAVVRIGFIQPAKPGHDHCMALAGLVDGLIDTSTTHVIAPRTRRSTP